MKRSHKIAVGIVAAAGLGFAAASLYAEPGPMGGGMGPGMGHGMMGGMGTGTMQHGGFGGPGVGQQLMTPEERQAFTEKMRSAKTPEERQKLAEANRAEMEKRAKEKGIALPEHRGPHAGFGPGSAAQTR
jgi:Spy/CpxP family protein refolding chaperone